MKMWPIAMKVICGFLLLVQSMPAVPAAGTSQTANKLCEAISVTSPCSCDSTRNPPDLTCKLQADSLPIFNSTAKYSADFSVSTLDLSGSNLSNVHEVLLSSVNRIHTLRVRHCELTQVPKAFLKVRGLRVLDLSYNNFTFFFMDIIAQSLIRTLRLSHNHLEQLSIKAGGPSKLTVLDVSHNKLKQLPKRLWQNLQGIHMSNNILSHLPNLTLSSELRVFDLSHNNLTHFPVNFLSTTPSLKKLVLAGNQIQQLKDLSGQQKLAHLRHLDLSNNQIQYIKQGLLNRTSSLGSLDLSHNQLTTLSHVHLPPHDARLNSLNLSHNSLYFLHRATFHNLHHLRYLDLSNNAPLGERGVKHLGFPEHLITLDLSNCTLTEVNYCQFSHLHDLTQLHLRDNPLHCSCHLSLLYNWYMKHHKIDDDTPEESGTWKCVSNETGSLIRVATKPACSDTICPTARLSTEVQVSVSTVSAKHNLIVLWEVSEMKPEIKGFKVLCLHTEEEHSDTALHTSPFLSKALRSYTLTDFYIDQDYSVCVDIMLNRNQILKRVCQTAVGDSPNILMGILAGSVFLIPCLIFITYIAIKDRKIQRKRQLADCNDDHDSQSFSAPDTTKHSRNTGIELDHAIFPPQDKDTTDASDPESVDPSQYSLQQACLPHMKTVSTQTEISVPQSRILQFPQTTTEDPDRSPLQPSQTALDPHLHTAQQWRTCPPMETCPDTMETDHPTENTALLAPAACSDTSSDSQTATDSSDTLQNLENADGSNELDSLLAQLQAIESQDLP